MCTHSDPVAIMVLSTLFCALPYTGQPKALFLYAAFFTGTNNLASITQKLKSLLSLATHANTLKHHGAKFRIFKDHVMAGKANSLTIESRRNARMQKLPSSVFVK